MILEANFSWFPFSKLFLVLDHLFKKRIAGLLTFALSVNGFIDGLVV